MIHLETDLEKISRISKSKKRENLSFRTFLKGKDNDKLDVIIQRLNKEIEGQIDCTKCGNCCINLRPCLTKNEIDTLARIDDISSDVFIEKYTEEDNFENIKYLKDTPCKYLSDKKCTIYDNRPEDCRSFPHTHKSSFNSRTMGIIDNYGICPIVFNLLERLKMELRFRY
ncbi:MAG: YkgJ family cysteine cluster protein [Bacteroidales bacterium]